MHQWRNPSPLDQPLLYNIKPPNPTMLQAYISSLFPTSMSLSLIYCNIQDPRGKEQDILVFQKQSTQCIKKQPYTPTRFSFKLRGQKNEKQRSYLRLRKGGIHLLQYSC